MSRTVVINILTILALWLVGLGLIYLGYRLLTGLASLLITLE